MNPMFTQYSRCPTEDGWSLHLRRERSLHPTASPRRPVLFVPGLGMNGFIFHHHPDGASFAQFLTVRGFDAWSLDLRGSRSSHPPPGISRWSATMADMAFLDLPSAIHHILRETGSSSLDLIGCSLGGTLAYAALGAQSLPVRRLVTMGSPLRWTARTSLVRSYARVGTLLSRLPIPGTRAAASWMLPAVRRIAPDLLAVYLNPRLTNCRDAATLTRTIEDPVPDLHRTLSRWILETDLVLDGHHVTGRLGSFCGDTAIVTATGDGICPPDASRSAHGHLGGRTTDIEVDHPTERVSHVDLFISRHAHTATFAPIADFLRA